MNIIQILNCKPDLAVERFIHLLCDLRLLKDANQLILEEHDMQPTNFWVCVIYPLDMICVFEGQRDSFTFYAPQEVFEILA